MYELKLWYKYSTWYEPCHVHVSQINRVSAIRGNLWRCVSLLFISKWIQFKLRAFQLGIVIVEGISFLFLFNFKLAIRCINWKVRNIHFNYSQVFPNTFCKVCIFWQTAENQLRLHCSFLARGLMKRSWMPLLYIQTIDEHFFCFHSWFDT